MAKKSISTELKELVSLIPSDKQAIGGRLADELVFMHKTLEELKDQIETLGAVEHFKNGKQDFLRESPALKSYTQLSKQFNATLKQLTDLCPKSVQAENSSAIYDFIKAGSL